MTTDPESAEPEPTPDPEETSYDGVDGGAGLDPALEEDGPTELVEPAEPVERRYPSTIGGAFYIAVLVATAVGLVVAALGEWRLGVRVLAAALGAAGLLRLVLPQRDAGMLAIRNRPLDVALLAAVAVALWILAGDIPDQPTFQ